MDEYLVTLAGRCIVSGSVVVEAENFDDARKEALKNISDASWPIDECGSPIRPDEQDGDIVVDYAKNKDTGEEKYFDEPVPGSNNDDEPADDNPFHPASPEGRAWEEGRMNSAGTLVTPEISADSPTTAAPIPTIDFQRIAQSAGWLVSRNDKNEFVAHDARSGCQDEEPTYILHSVTEMDAWRELCGLEGIIEEKSVAAGQTLGTRKLLEEAEAFIAGFEGDELQEGIDGDKGLLARLRQAIGLPIRRENRAATVTAAPPSAKADNASVTALIDASLEMQNALRSAPFDPFAHGPISTADTLLSLASESLKKSPFGQPSSDDATSTPTDLLQAALEALLLAQERLEICNYNREEDEHIRSIKAVIEKLEA